MTLYLLNITLLVSGGSPAAPSAGYKGGSALLIISCSDVIRVDRILLVVPDTALNLGCHTATVWPHLSQFRLLVIFHFNDIREQNLSFLTALVLDLCLPSVLYRPGRPAGGWETPPVLPLAPEGNEDRSFFRHTSPAWWSLCRACL